MELGNGSYGKVYGSPAGLLYSNNGLLQLYRQEEKISKSDLLRWSDSNLGSNPVEVIWISEEKLAAAYNTDQGHKLYLLTRTRVEEVPERQELVLAGIYISGKLENWVTEFNQSNEQYHITIESLTRSESDLARLDIMLVSSNPPDILDMTYMNVMKYANKQMLEDLSSYLEMEELPGKEGCLDNFVEGYTVGGRLVGIPKYFTIDVLMGRESQVGSKIGWTMEEVYALSDKYPESKLMSMDNFEYVLEELCADYILDAFIDWEKGDCFFNSGEFRNLMQWLDEHTSRVDRIYAEGDYRNGVVPDDMLLLDNEIRFAGNLMYYRALFGDDMIVMGFPTVDGSIYYRGVPEMLIGITSGSRHKEGAGQFMEFFLSKELELSNAFSIYKDDLTQLLEDMMTPEYMLDAKGELWLENGMPVPRAKGSYVVDGEVVEYYAMTQEQADEIWNVIAAADFTPVGGVRKEVINIIMEEMRSYLYREKGLDEVTDIIQNRVRTLVQESM